MSEFAVVTIAVNDFELARMHIDFTEKNLEVLYVGDQSMFDVMTSEPMTYSVLSEWLNYYCKSKLSMEGVLKKIQEEGFFIHSQHNLRVYVDLH